MICFFTYCYEWEQFHAAFLIRALNTPRWAEVEIYLMGGEL